MTTNPLEDTASKQQFEKSTWGIREGGLFTNLRTHGGITDVEKTRLRTKEQAGTSPPPPIPDSWTPAGTAQTPST